MTAIYGLMGDFSPEQLKLLGERLKHRGHGTRAWSPAPRIWFGLRSNSANELTEAADGDLCLADASLYNHVELKRGLGEDPSLGDAELLQRLVEEWGPTGLARVNGDYVTALWDDLENRLLLARSPLGAKALYVCTLDGGLAFASEYKAFYALEEFKPEVDRSALQYLQAAKYLPQERTLLRNVQAVPAGECLFVGAGEIQRNRFWNIELAVKKVPSKQAADELRRIFLEAVRRRSQDVGALGAEMSGGIDSAAVVAALRKAYPGRTIKTFTIGAGPEDPEIVSSRIVAARFDTDHSELFFQAAQLPELVPPTVWHLEDPVGRTESVLYYQLMRMATQHVEVILGGYASDGLYAGMPKHKLLRLIQYLPIVDTGIEEFYHYTQTSRLPESVIGRLLRRLYYGPTELPMPRVLGADLEPSSLHLRNQKTRMLTRQLRDGVLEGVPGWMPKVEKPHAAFDVEVRSPFTDPQLVAHAFTLPDGLKMRGLREKYVLRKALLPLLPEEIARRPKFPQRMDYDLDLSRALDSMAEVYLGSSDVKQRGIFAEEDIAALRRRPAGRAYSPNRAMRLWTAIATEMWARIFLDCRGELPEELTPIQSAVHAEDSVA